MGEAGDLSTYEVAFERPFPAGLFGSGSRGWPGPG
jgi:hypothetical protein